MCYDQEKTQGPADPRSRAYEVAENQMHDQIRDGRTPAFADAGQVGRALSTAEILHKLFSYHPPTPETLPKFAAINQAAKNFAEVILQNCPAGMDRSWAIGLIRSARMAANAAVALNSLSL
jgi:hypothetical protein